MYLTDEQAADIWQQGYEAHLEYVCDPGDHEARDYANTLWLAYLMFTK